MFKHVCHICLFVASLLGLFSCTSNGENKLEEGPSPARTPAEELASFQIESGLKIQLVAAEPMVQDPVVIDELFRAHIIT